MPVEDYKLGHYLEYYTVAHWSFFIFCFLESVGGAFVFPGEEKHSDQNGMFCDYLIIQKHSQ